MKLSIVATLFRSAPYIELFYTRVRQAAMAITPAYEIIFVNDGSPDNSLALAQAIVKCDPQVKVVDLSRNFGHHKAMMTGLGYATGDLILLIDVDLEEPPELLTQFYKIFQSNEVDVVFGVMDRRRGDLFRRLAGGVFFRLFNWLSPISLPANMLVARLMSHRYVEALLQHKEQVFIIGALWQLTGFRQLALVVEKQYKGKTSYSLLHRVTLFINSLTSFSNKPLIYISYLGLLLLIPSGLLIILFTIQRLVSGVGVDGWTSLIVSIWFLGGLVILVLGMMALYLSVIFTEVKARPYTIVRQIYENTDRKAENHD
jgi:putative glycosyltransferase